jgi:ferrochelatase
MTQRYQAIGGSPLTAHTNAQARALEVRIGIPVFVATRFGDPNLAAGLSAAAARGIGRLCVVPLAPFSVKVYTDAVAAASTALRGLGKPVPECVGVAPWGTETAFVGAHAAAIEATLGVLDGAARAEILLTAHSLPVRVIAGGDGYQREVEACADAITDRLGRPTHLAYQSQGADGGEWLGPDLRDELKRLRRDGATDVVIAPFGFLAEHVETLYDLDIEALAVCRELGLRMNRVPALNAAPGLIDALAAVATRALRESPRSGVAAPTQ